MTPVPTKGFGNITNTPPTVDVASANLRLHSDSRRINAGRKGFVPASQDLDQRAQDVPSPIKTIKIDFRFRS